MKVMEKKITRPKHNNFGKKKKSQDEARGSESAGKIDVSLFLFFSLIDIYDYS